MIFYGKTLPVNLVFTYFLFTILSCSKNTTPTKSFDWNASTFTQNGYTLNWQTNDVNFDVGVKKELVETFFTVYPTLAKDFNPNVSKTVLFWVDTAYKGVAATSGSQVVYNPKWFVQHPKDIDVVTHEVMHIIQGYPSYNPWWLVEGIADYVRYKYGVANAEGGWSLPAVTSNQKYNNGYRITARFLVWCEKKKTGSVKQFDSALRSNNYTPQLWNSIFEKNVDNLWDEYLANPAI